MREAREYGYAYTSSRQERLQEAWGEGPEQCRWGEQELCLIHHVPLGYIQATTSVIKTVSRRELAPTWIESKFIRLRDEWKAQRGYSSSTEQLVMHSAYQKIIGMGSDAIPLILRELATSPDRWFWALRAITDEDPVLPEARGNSEAMRQAWLEWGREQGYQW